MSELQKFKLYLIGRLNELDKKRKGELREESEFDLAYGELNHIFTTIYPALETERKSDLRDFERKHVRVHRG